MAHYQIIQLEIGYDNAFPAGVAFDFWNMGDQQVYSPFSVTLLEGEGHKILFDCGFDPESAFGARQIAQENDQNCHNTAEVLASNGVEAAEIDTVVISHCHWDHLQGLKYFPQANIYIQREEYAGWLRAMSDDAFPQTHKIVIDSECLALLEQWVDEGKVTLLDGDVYGFLPGIDLRTAKGHSFCQSMLFVRNDSGKYAIIGDVAMRPESFVGNNAFPCYLPNLKFSVGTIEDITRSYREIMDWVGGDTSRIVCSHDGTNPEKRTAKINALGLRAFIVA